MRPATAKIWASQNQHEGDRERLFTALAAHIGDGRVLYPGSYVDVAASMAFSEVTYVDLDRRAARFFEDVDGVTELVGRTAEVHFVAGDYTTDLGLEADSFDVLVSLYAGPVSHHCTDHLRVGGHLLVNPSHGDAALASLDDRYELVGVVVSRDGGYRIRTDGLEASMVPKRPIELTRTQLLDLGKGIAYTKPAFAYLFERIR